MILKTERLIIRAYTLDDVVGLLPILSDPRTMEWWPQPLTLAEVETWISTALKRYETDGYGRYAMLLKDQPGLIGDCGIVKTTIDGQPANDLGYIVHYPHWRRGLATEAAQALKAYAWSTLGLTELHANMAAAHIGSRQVAESIGMTLLREFDNPRNRNIRTCLYELRR